MATEATAAKFFSSKYFAVVGASTDPSKFGHKIFTWYTQHALPVTPINPTAAQIKAFGAWPDLEQKSFDTLPNISELPNPKETGVSIITPPRVTIEVLKEAKKLGIQSVWLQPGTFNDEVIQFANENFEAPVAGDGGRGGEGWCVLVDGEKALGAAGKSEGKL
ncbi:CoA binding domain-containing protein [Phlyctema vagabunda]|uniref:CoA binding domain-containing protein n=1 Tax=Phlyctema vagabunda TaxID=108571 RepID=A0ABR4PYQ3_9HELO